MLQLIDLFIKNNDELIKIKFSKLKSLVLPPKYNCISRNLSRFMGYDPADSGLVTESMFREVLDQFVGYDLSEHEILTIGRIKLQNKLLKYDPFG